jgi:predicted amidohydrolase YtcJ
MALSCKKSSLAVWIYLCFCILSACRSVDNQQTADAIYINGRIWTGAGDDVFVSALAVKGNTILAAGSDDEIKGFKSEKTQVVDLQGHLVVPGFNDAHMHFTSGASILSNVDLLATTSLQEMKSAIIAFAQKHPEKKWLKGRGWQYGFFPGGMPDKSYLDSLVPDRPVFLSAYDGHTGLANSKALELAGINKHSTYKGFGSIVKDASGNPTGVFLEDAQSIIKNAIPADTWTEKLSAAENCMKHLSEMGITSVQNAHGDADEYKLFKTLLDSNKFSVRYAVAFSVDHETKPETINVYIQLKKLPTDRNWFKAEAIKFMIDGVIESHTAIMLNPYSDIPKEHAEQKNDFAIPIERYRDLVVQLDSLGFQLYTHAIGDRSVREVLNAYELAINRNKRSDQRFRIEHIEQVQPDDIPRFASLGVLPSMQPIHADPGTVDVWGRNVGQERLPNSFVWNSMIKSGATLVYGSDWPACISLNPIHGLHSAVNRQTIKGVPEGGWVPEQRITVAQALKAYTVNGAFASFDEKTKGKLEKGFLADFVVLSQDLFTINPSKIHETKVVLTIVDGKERFRNAEFKSSK